MTEYKQKALETLSKIKELYESDESGLLCGSFYTDFMAVVNDQIREIEETTY